MAKTRQHDALRDRPGVAADRLIAPPPRRLSEDRLHGIIRLLGVAGSAVERRIVLLAEYQLWTVDQIAAELALSAGRVIELLKSIIAREELAERTRHRDEILAANLAEKPPGHPWLKAKEIHKELREARRNSKRNRARSRKRLLIAASEAPKGVRP